MVRLRTVLPALLLLAYATAAAQERASPPPRCAAYTYPSISSLRICTQLDLSALSRPGDSTILRITVESDGKPFLVRVHNSSPGVIRLQGGDNQIVHMGCLRHHEVRRWVTLSTAGEPRLEVRPYDPTPGREPSAIAVSLAPLLAKIEAEFRERRGRLEASPDYSATAVTELLDRTEAELLQVLNYRELAALRDYVRKGFEDARDALARSHESRSTATRSQPRAVFASMTPPRRAVILPAQNRGTVSKPAADSVVDEILRKIHRLYEMAISNDMAVNLCVTSAPEDGARFEMRPQSYYRWKGTGTTGELANVYRGIYIFKMVKDRQRQMSCLDARRCPAIDLVDQPPNFHCDLDGKLCQQLSAPPPQGVCHGNGS